MGLNKINKKIVFLLFCILSINSLLFPNNDDLTGDKKKVHYLSTFI